MIFLNQKCEHCATHIVWLQMVVPHLLSASQQHQVGCWALHWCSLQSHTAKWLQISASHHWHELCGKEPEELNSFQQHWCVIQEETQGLHINVLLCNNVHKLAKWKTRQQRVTGNKGRQTLIFTQTTINEKPNATFCNKQSHWTFNTC